MATTFAQALAPIKRKPVPIQVSNPAGGGTVVPPPNIAPKVPAGVTLGTPQVTPPPPPPGTQGAGWMTTGQGMNEQAPYPGAAGAGPVPIKPPPGLPTKPTIAAPAGPEDGPGSPNYLGGGARPSVGGPTVAPGIVSPPPGTPGWNPANYTPDKVINPNTGTNAAGKTPAELAGQTLGPSALPAPPGSGLTYKPDTRFDPATQGGVTRMPLPPGEQASNWTPGGPTIMPRPPLDPPPTNPSPIPGETGTTSAATPGTVTAPVTGNETPFTVTPGQTNAEAQLSDPLIAEAKRQLEQPTVYDDSLFQSALKQGQGYLDEQAGGASQALAAELAGRGLDYGNTAGSRYRDLQTEGFRAKEDLNTNLLRERAQALASGRQASYNNALAAVDQSTSNARANRGEVRGERDYLDTLRNTAHDQAVNDYQLTNQSEQQNESAFQQALQAALASGDPSQVAQLLGSAGSGYSGMAQDYTYQEGQANAGLGDLATQIGSTLLPKPKPKAA